MAIKVTALWCGLLVALCGPPAATALRADDIDIYALGAAGEVGTDCDVPVATSLVAPALSAQPQRSTAPDAGIFFPLFEAGGSGRWLGNVKKLKIAPLLETDDATGVVTSREVIAQAPLTNPPQAAISAQDGHILADALTFWTDPAGADVIAHDAAAGEVAGRDGRSVTRGGAGQQIPGFLTHSVGGANAEPGARQLYTLDPARPGQLLALDATMRDVSGLAAYLDPAGLLTPERARSLIRWIRGQDAFDQDGDRNLSETRGWLLGDVLHSRPLVINYGARPGTGYSRDNPDIRLFFGSNDGFFHSLRNTWPDAAGSESGRESWAFIPPQMLAVQAAAAQSPAPTHPYGMDGEPVAYVHDSNLDGNIDSGQGDAVWVFIGQRRGGRGLYAFDVSDPDRPRFGWQITHQTPGFQQLALTFSTPRLAWLELGEATPTPVLVFAAGYNGGPGNGGRLGKDAGSAADLIGNAIYVVSATDGRLLWQAVGPGGEPALPDSEQRHFVAAMTHSIPSPLTLVDSDNNGIEDRAYVGDSAGNVWRVDFGAARNWQVTQLASLGGRGAADRRFFHAPDVVRSRDGGGDYHGIVIVSGNRAAPLDSAVTNYAFFLKDRRSAAITQPIPGAPATAITADKLADVTGLCAVAAQQACAGADLALGWKLALEAPGEKGLSSPLVSNGLVFFTSYLPPVGSAGSSCPLPPGRGRAYAVQLANGAPGLPPAGRLDWRVRARRHADIGPGMYGDVVPYRDRVLVPGRGIDGRRLLSIPGRLRWRIYWREEEVDAL